MKPKREKHRTWLKGKGNKTKKPEESSADKKSNECNRHGVLQEDDNDNATDNEIETVERSASCIETMPINAEEKEQDHNISAISLDKLEETAHSYQTNGIDSQFSIECISSNNEKDDSNDEGDFLVQNENEW